MRSVEQGAHDDVSPARDAREPSRAGAFDGIHEKRLGSIARGVSRENPRGGARGSRFSRELPYIPARCGIANLACGTLEVLPAQIGKARVLDAKRHPQLFAEGAHELLVAIGRLSPQMMIHVKHMEALASDARAAPTVVHIERSRAC